MSAFSEQKLVKAIISWNKFFVDFYNFDTILMNKNDKIFNKNVDSRWLYLVGT